MTDTPTDLDGATEPGEVNAWPASPGEFAARWNASTEEQRQAKMRAIEDAADHSNACLIGNHVARIAQLAAAREGSASQLVTAVLGTDDWVIVVEGGTALVDDEQLDALEQSGAA